MLLNQKIGLSSIALALILNSTVAFAGVKKVDIDVSKLPSSVLTTIADVKVDAEGAVVYANNDIRVLRINADSKKMIDEAILAKKNGWEVKLALKTTATGNKFDITSLQIKSRKNVLTTGFNMPDRNFSPIVVSNNNEAEALFSSVYPYDSNNYDVNDNCFNRAQYWSRMHQVGQKVQGSDQGTDKVFIFFTDAYRRQFNHKWWFHVAPVIYVGNKSNPVVLDPTFMNSAVSLADWLGAFDHFTHGNCIKAESMDDYYRHGNQPVCLYITASMFNYTPSDLNARKLNNWRCSDFDRVRQGIPAPGSNSINRNASWNDSQNLFLIPEMCGGPAIPSRVNPEPIPVPTPVPTPVEDDKPTDSPSSTKFVARIVGGGASVELRAGPGASHAVIGHIPTNSLVNFVPTGNDWLEVITPAGMLGADPVRGYLPKSSIELVR